MLFARMNRTASGSFILLLLNLTCVTEGGIFDGPPAIFTGILDQAQNEPNEHFRPPPPPMERTSPVSSSSSSTNTTWQNEEQHRPVPPPPQKGNERRHRQQQGQVPPWVMGPPQHPSGWRNNSPNPRMPAARGPPPPAHILQHDLSQALLREQELQRQLHNLTSIAATVEQREDLHVRQLDVLTERVMEVDARAAREHNLLLESEANCTELAKRAGVLEQDMDEWKARCSELEEKKQEDEVTIGNLKKKLRNMSLKAEDLAAMIEKHRLDDGIGTYRQKTRKRRGLFSWLFGGGNEIDVELGEAFEAGRSTLLEALQTERGNVEELEASVSLLQQNNTAIAEQVKSRDLIISELNDRVAVFEEDKVVLKAALRQLQKEMNEEAPKTQKLIEELEDAREEIDRLQREMESLVETHQDEISALQDAIASQQNTLDATESNLTVIGTYVDKLEERLADFAVARRDIEKREQQCQTAEKKAGEAELEKEKMLKRVAELENEHSELKEVFEELIQARTRLQNEFSQLTKERNDLFVSKNQLESTVQVLQEQIQNLEEEKTAVQSRVQELETSLEDKYSAKRHIDDQLNQLTAEKGDLERRLGEAGSVQRELEDLLQSMEANRAELKSRVAELEVSHQLPADDTTSSKEIERMSEELADLRANMADQSQTHQEALDALLKETQEKDVALQRAEQQSLLLEEDLRAARTFQIELEKKVSDREAELQTLTEKILNAPSAGKGTTDVTNGEGLLSPNTTTTVAPLLQVTEKKDEDIFFDASQGLHRNPSGEVDGNHKQSNPQEQAYLNTTSFVSSQNNETTTENNPAPKDPLAMFRSSTVERLPVNGTSNATNRTMTGPFNRQGSAQRSVPFRKIRKFFSKTTGVHGLFTPSSTQHRKPPSPPTKPPASATRTPILKKHGPDTDTPKTPPPRGRPDVVRHTLGGIRLPQMSPTKR